MPDALQIKLVRHLLQLQRKRATGALTVIEDDLFTVVYFENGRAVFADSPAVSQTLGRLLVEEGIITQEEYTTAIDELHRTLATDRRARLGGILVKLGFTTVEGVQHALVNQVARRIAEIIQYPEPTWTWREGAAELHGVPRYPMRVEPLIFTGICKYYDRAKMTRLLSPYRGGQLVLRAPTELITRCFSLRPELAAMVESITGDEVTESWLMRQESEDAWPLVTALAMTGVLSVVQPVATAAGVPMDAEPDLDEPGDTGVFQVPEVLRVQPSARKSEPGERSNVGREFVPEPQRQSAFRPNREPRAPDQGQLPRRMVPTRDQLARLEAESACRIGLDHLHAEKFDDAEHQFGIAARAMPSVPEYQLYWVWTRARIDGDFDPGTLTNLEQLATTAARHDSRHAFPPYVLAYIASERGDNETAMRYFKVAHRRDPDNRDAGNQLRRLERSRR